VSAVRFRPQPDPVSPLRNAPFSLENRESLKTVKVKENASFSKEIVVQRHARTTPA